MKTIQLTGHGKEEFWVNADNIAYVVQYEGSTTVRFVGSKDNQIAVTETSREVAAKMR